MSRDYRKLRAFQLVHNLAVRIYTITRGFPKSELFGITSQMRRTAISVPANIVEGCFRPSGKEYLNFLNIALASLAELGYYIDLSSTLGLLSESDHENLHKQFQTTIRTLQALISSIKTST